MINPARWILVETWLSLGLRMEWAASYEEPSQKFQRSLDGGREFAYRGHGVWIVRREPWDKPGLGFSDLVTPEMSTTDMRHELAHWIAATKAEREQANFDMGEDDNADANTEAEDRALLVEQAIGAVVRASGNIAAMALGGQGK